MLQMTPTGVSPPKKQLPTSSSAVSTTGEGPSRHSNGPTSTHKHSSSLSNPRAKHHSDPNRLAPEDAFYAHSPPRRQRPFVANGASTGLDSAVVKDTLHGALLRGVNGTTHGRREKDRGRSGSRRRKGQWKKLLWVKQSYPDNYTDEETFLDHLQRNPRLQPYDFWPLVADSTVIVQHVCSVIIFVCCFVGIFQERVSPVAVVSWASFGTVIGWVLWDCWVGQEEATNNALAEFDAAADAEGGNGVDDPSSASSASSSFNIGSSHLGPSHLGPSHHPVKDEGMQGLGVTLPNPTPGARHSHTPSATSVQSLGSVPSPVLSGHPTGAASFASYSYYPPYGAPASSISPRNQQRLATAKSAVLIYCALLGLSPILKSLTKSTTSDSIWAMSCWLMCINVFFFDYGGGMEIKWVESPGYDYDVTDS